LIWHARTSGPAPATPFGEGVVGRANFLISRETFLAQGNPSDLNGCLDLLGLEIAVKDAVTHIGPARKVRPTDGKLRLELDLGDRTLIRRKRGEECVSGIHDIDRVRRGEQCRRGRRCGCDLHRGAGRC
jgi:hypothetical protein